MADQTAKAISSMPGRVDAGGRVLEQVHGVDGALRPLQDVLAPLRLAQDERRVVALDLHAQRLLRVVDEGGIEERGQRGHAQEDESGHARPGRKARRRSVRRAAFHDGRRRRARRAGTTTRTGGPPCPPGQ